MGISRLSVPLNGRRAFVHAGLPNTGISGIEFRIAYGENIDSIMRTMRRLGSLDEDIVIQLTQGVPLDRPYSPLFEEGNFVAGGEWSHLTFGMGWEGTMDTINRETDYTWDYSKIYLAVWPTRGVVGLQLEAAITYNEV